MSFHSKQRQRRFDMIVKNVFVGFSGRGSFNFLTQYAPMMDLKVLHMVGLFASLRQGTARFKTVLENFTVKKSGIGGNMPVKLFADI